MSKSRVKTAILGKITMCICASLLGPPSCCPNRPLCSEFSIAPQFAPQFAPNSCSRPLQLVYFSSLGGENIFLWVEKNGKTNVKFGKNYSTFNIVNVMGQKSQKKEQAKVSKKDRHHFGLTVF